MVSLVRAWSLKKAIPGTVAAPTPLADVVDLATTLAAKTFVRTTTSFPVNDEPRVEDALSEDTALDLHHALRSLKAMLTRLGPHSPAVSASLSALLNWFAYVPLEVGDAQADAFARHSNEAPDSAPVRSTNDSGSLNDSSSLAVIAVSVAEAKTLLKIRKACTHAALFGLFFSTLLTPDLLRALPSELALQIMRAAYDGIRSKLKIPSKIPSKFDLTTIEANAVFGLSQLSAVLALTSAVKLKDIIIEFSSELEDAAKPPHIIHLLRAVSSLDLTAATPRPETPRLVLSFLGKLAGIVETGKPAAKSGDVRVEVLRGLPRLLLPLFRDRDALVELRGLPGFPATVSDLHKAVVKMCGKAKTAADGYLALSVVLPLRHANLALAPKLFSSSAFLSPVCKMFKGKTERAEALRALATFFTALRLDLDPDIGHTDVIDALDAPLAKVTSLLFPIPSAKQAAKEAKASRKAALKTLSRSKPMARIMAMGSLTFSQVVDIALAEHTPLNCYVDVIVALVQLAPELAMDAAFFNLLTDIKWPKRAALGFGALAAMDDACRSAAVSHVLYDVELVLSSLSHWWMALDAELGNLLLSNSKATAPNADAFATHFGSGLSFGLLLALVRALPACVSSSYLDTMPEILAKLVKLMVHTDARLRDAAHASARAIFDAAADWGSARADLINHLSVHIRSLPAENKLTRELLPTYLRTLVSWLETLAVYGAPSIHNESLSGQAPANDGLNVDSLRASLLLALCSVLGEVRSLALHGFTLLDVHLNNAAIDSGSPPPVTIMGLIISHGSQLLARAHRLDSPDDVPSELTVEELSSRESRSARDAWARFLGALGAEAARWQALAPALGIMWPIALGRLAAVQPRPIGKAVVIGDTSNVARAAIKVTFSAWRNYLALAMATVPHKAPPTSSDPNAPPPLPSAFLRPDLTVIPPTSLWTISPFQFYTWTVAALFSAAPAHVDAVLEAVPMASTSHAGAFVTAITSFVSGLVSDSLFASGGAGSSDSDGGPPPVFTTDQKLRTQLAASQLMALLVPRLDSDILHMDGSLPSIVADLNACYFGYRWDARSGVVAFNSAGKLSTTRGGSGDSDDELADSEETLQEIESQALLRLSSLSFMYKQLRKQLFEAFAPLAVAKTTPPATAIVMASAALSTWYGPEFENGVFAATGKAMAWTRKLLSQCADCDAPLFDIARQAAFLILAQSATLCSPETTTGVLDRMSALVLETEAAPIREALFYAIGRFVLVRTADNEPSEQASNGDSTDAIRKPGPDIAFGPALHLALLQWASPTLGTRKLALQVIDAITLGVAAESLIMKGKWQFASDVSSKCLQWQFELVQSLMTSCPHLARSLYETTHSLLVDRKLGFETVNQVLHYMLPMLKVVTEAAADAEVRAAKAGKAAGSRKRTIALLRSLLKLTLLYGEAHVQQLERAWQLVAATLPIYAVMAFLLDVGTNADMPGFVPVAKSVVVYLVRYVPQDVVLMLLNVLQLRESDEHEAFSQSLRSYTSEASLLPAFLERGRAGPPPSARISQFEMAVILLSELIPETAFVLTDATHVVLNAGVLLMDSPNSVVWHHAKVLLVNVIAALAPSTASDELVDGLLDSLTATEAPLWAREPRLHPRLKVGDNDPSTTTLQAFVGDLVQLMGRETVTMHAWSLEALKWGLKAKYPHQARRALQIFRALPGEFMMNVLEALMQRIHIGISAAAYDAIELPLLREMLVSLAAVFDSIDLGRWLSVGVPSGALLHADPLRTSRDGSGESDEDGGGDDAADDLDTSTAGAQQVVARLGAALWATMGLCLTSSPDLFAANFYVFAAAVRSLLLRPLLGIDRSGRYGDSPKPDIVELFAQLDVKSYLETAYPAMWSEQGGKARIPPMAAVLVKAACLETTASAAYDLIAAMSLLGKTFTGLWPAPKACVTLGPLGPLHVYAWLLAIDLDFRSLHSAREHDAECVLALHAVGSALGVPELGELASTVALPGPDREAGAESLAETLAHALWAPSSPSSLIFFVWDSLFMSYMLGREEARVSALSALLAVLRAGASVPERHSELAKLLSERTPVFHSLAADYEAAGRMPARVAGLERRGCGRSPVSLPDMLFSVLEEHLALTAQLSLDQNNVDPDKYVNAFAEWRNMLHALNTRSRERSRADFVHRLDAVVGTELWDQHEGESSVDAWQALLADVLMEHFSGLDLVLFDETVMELALARQASSRSNKDGLFANDSGLSVVPRVDSILGPDSPESTPRSVDRVVILGPDNQGDETIDSDDDGEAGASMKRSVSAVVERRGGRHGSRGLRSRASEAPAPSRPVRKREPGKYATLKAVRSPAIRELEMAEMTDPPPGASEAPARMSAVPSRLLSPTSMSRQRAVTTSSQQRPGARVLEPVSTDNVSTPVRPTLDVSHSSKSQAQSPGSPNLHILKHVRRWKDAVRGSEAGDGESFAFVPLAHDIVSMLQRDAAVVFAANHGVLATVPDFALISGIRDQMKELQLGVRARVSVETADQRLELLRAKVDPELVEEILTERGELISHFGSRLRRYISCKQEVVASMELAVARSDDAFALYTFAIEILGLVQRWSSVTKAGLNIELWIRQLMGIDDNDDVGHSLELVAQLNESAGFVIKSLKRAVVEASRAKFAN
ncbi:uncharacterized protein AMSG_05299 [Thecamonas trahens ATCC 50062]|uniref:Cell morphogenesis central region domain-containing protein n=1 Tax=Thecamonas trahens ATCC 50062 TaxID=461836 RepID=A0A0L0DAD4_THETB|nr:hypothetical protein AMSG_05299 [Thecamonas trahens ATCC 50062]KNC49302.1 hypothetical protein AMSG_05299 [Thecamonas trahens ATCC 50062]|eukprot:XP_013758012.1 hypothetical protein AMSG_05299 [Thecamonas trahens ATCC 50062]